MLRVKRDMTIKVNGEDYGLGDAIKDLTPDEENSLVKKGYCERIKIHPPAEMNTEEVGTTSSNGLTGEGNNDGLMPSGPDQSGAEINLPSITDMTVADIQQVVAGIDDVNILYTLLETEQSNKNRKTVIEALEVKIDALEEFDDADDQLPDLNFNPDDAVQMAGR